MVIPHCGSMNFCSIRKQGRLFDLVYNNRISQNKWNVDHFRFYDARIILLWKKFRFKMISDKIVLSCIFFTKNSYFLQYQPSGDGGTRSPPATPHSLQHHHRLLNSKWPTGSGNKSTLCYWTPWTTFTDYVCWFNHSFYENLKNPKWPPGGFKMADGVWKGGTPKFLWAPINFR